MARGGKREGAGRPKQEINRKMKNMRAFDHEWELIKDFARICKKDFEKAKQIVEDLKK